jgi:hypothetical protein
LTLPQFTPADPKLIRDAFDHEDFVFELKMDGFRGLALHRAITSGPPTMKELNNSGVFFKWDCQMPFR